MLPGTTRNVQYNPECTLRAKYAATASICRGAQQFYTGFCDCVTGAILLRKTTVQ